MNDFLKIGLIIGVVLVVGFAGFQMQQAPTGFVTLDASGIEATEIRTFSKAGLGICEEEGKPVIRLFSTTWCPHCAWVEPAFEAAVKEYVERGEIVAKHWEVDIGDDTLSPGIETSVPASETAVFQKFNPSGTIPTFVFGCKYYRIGTGYETSDDLEAEIGEFKAVIEALLKE